MLERVLPLLRDKISAVERVLEHYLGHVLAKLSVDPKHGSEFLLLSFELIVCHRVERRARPHIFAAGHGCELSLRDFVLLLMLLIVVVILIVLFD